MFSRKNRIPKEILEKVIEQKKSLGSDFFNVKFLGNKIKTPRFAIIVSKKVCKSSVGRHLLKRRFSSIIKEEFDFFTNKDCAFFIKKEANKESFKNLKKNFKGFISENSL